jgi:hypothetical protein
VLPSASLSQPPIPATCFHHLPVPVISAALSSRAPGQSGALRAVHPRLRGSCSCPLGARLVTFSKATGRARTLL